MKQMPKIGWRHFVCCGCAHTWRWPCRDFTSDSGESCPKCDVWNYPQDGTPDDTIPHDGFGNLRVPHNWEGAPAAPLGRVILRNLPGGYTNYPGMVKRVYMVGGEEWADIQWDVPVHPCTTPMQTKHLIPANYPAQPRDGRPAVEPENCAACHGSGRVPVTLASVTAPFECPDCDGTGKRRNDPAQLREGKE